MRMGGHELGPWTPVVGIGSGSKERMLRHALTAPSWIVLDDGAGAAFDPLDGTGASLDGRERTGLDPAGEIASFEEGGALRSVLAGDMAQALALTWRRGMHQGLVSRCDHVPAQALVAAAWMSEASERRKGRAILAREILDDDGLFGGWMGKWLSQDERFSATWLGARASVRADLAGGRRTHRDRAISLLDLVGADAREPCLSRLLDGGGVRFRSCGDGLRAEALCRMAVAGCQVLAVARKRRTCLVRAACLSSSAFPAFARPPHCVPSAFDGPVAMSAAFPGGEEGAAAFSERFPDASRFQDAAFVFERGAGAAEWAEILCAAEGKEHPARVSFHERLEAAAALDPTGGLFEPDKVRLRVGGRTLFLEE